jgi:hypothetical protein
MAFLERLVVLGRGRRLSSSLLISGALIFSPGLEVTGAARQSPILLLNTNDYNALYLLLVIE